ncbi:MAG TPA: alpha/beta fold hydrolase [Acidimicrobiales bacterium]|nr:alpha/beta fold hydrolase [Acidimicrobiales bacterium]
MSTFPTARTSVRGIEQVFTHLNPGGRGPSGAAPPLLLVHGWPETRRIWWRMLPPLAEAGYEVICPDLRGFGDSAVSPDGIHDVPTHSRDLHALCAELGHERVVLVGGDLGGPVIQDLALRFPGFGERMVLFNSPLPFDAERMAGMRTRPPMEAADYFIRQGTDPDGLAADLATPEARRRYIATFYTSRFWAHPGAFTADEVAFHTEPFADAAKLRASFGGYESVFDESKRSEPPLMTRNDETPTMILFGPSDHVIYPEFDRMAATVFERRVGPFLLRDCGHFVQWEAADVLVSAIDAWLS